MIESPILSDIAWHEIRSHFKGCRLCWASSKMGSRYPENTVLYETDNFVVTPAVGSFVPIYLLMISKKHVFSLGTLTQKDLQGIEGELNDLLKFLHPISPHWIIFEHGNNNPHESYSCNCIEHLHLHFIPLNSELCDSLIRQISEDLGSQFMIRTFNKLPNSLPSEKYTNYVLLRTPDNTTHLFVNPQIPSQYVRKKIVETFQIQKTWDWRSNNDIQNLKITLNIFKSNNIIRKRVYFAHPIEEINHQNIDLMLDESQKIFTEECPDFEVFSMFRHIDQNLARAIDSQENSDSILVKFEVHFLRFSDVLVVDLSYPDWQYVGALMEITYAYNLGIPVIAIVGKSNIANRRWLKGHVHEFVSDVREAATLVKNKYCFMP